MSNEISSLNINHIKGLNTNKQSHNDQVEERNLKADSDTGAPDRSSQQVSLTDTAAKLRQLEAKIADQPVVDTQRVESLKKSIADGTFKVDSSRTARENDGVRKFISQ